MASPLVVLYPAVYITLAIASLSYFRMAYAMIVSAAAAPVASPIIRDNVQPLLRQGLTFVRTCLGEPDKLTFNLTHIILTALILVIIIYLDAIRAAVAANRR